MLDATQWFDNPAGVALTATRDSTNTLDFLAQRDVGVGDEIEMHVFVQTVLASSGGAATLTISVNVSADNNTFYIIQQSPAYTEASLTAGKGLLRYKLPILSQLKYAGTVPAPRYLKLIYTVGTENFTSGKVGAYLTGAFDRQTFLAYPENYTTV